MTPDAGLVVCDWELACFLGERYTRSYSVTAPAGIANDQS